MSLPVRVEPEASRELEDAAIWYERQRNGLGQDFLAAVDQAVDRITQWPYAGTPISGLEEDIPGSQRITRSLRERLFTLADDTGV